jgi:hypothetical protein
MHATIQRKVLTELFPVRRGFDRRTRGGQRVFAHAQSILEQLDHEPSTAERALIMACAHQRHSLEILLEILEKNAFDRGEPLSAEYREQADLLTRQMAQLGILRMPAAPPVITRRPGTHVSEHTTHDARCKTPTSI